MAGATPRVRVRVRLSIYIYLAAPAPAATRDDDLQRPGPATTYDRDLPVHLLRDYPQISSGSKSRSGTGMDNG